MEGGRFPPPRKTHEAERLRQHLTKTKMCMFFQKGHCKYSGNCAFAHTPDELTCTPDLRKTSICKAWIHGKCSVRDCKFAHGERELRAADRSAETGLKAPVPPGMIVRPNTNMPPGVWGSMEPMKMEPMKIKLTSSAFDPASYSGGLGADLGSYSRVLQADLAILQQTIAVALAGKSSDPPRSASCSTRSPASPQPEPYPWQSEAHFGSGVAEQGTFTFDLALCGQIPRQKQSETWLAHW